MGNQGRSIENAYRAGNGVKSSQVVFIIAVVVFYCLRDRPQSCGLQVRDGIYL
jgi:sugar phosphate permease